MKKVIAIAILAASTVSGVANAASDTIQFRTSNGATCSNTYALADFSAGGNLNKSGNDYETGSQSAPTWTTKNDNMNSQSINFSFSTPIRTKDSLQSLDCGSLQALEAQMMELEAKMLMLDLEERMYDFEQRKEADRLDREADAQMEALPAAPAAPVKNDTTGGFFN